MEWLSRCLDIRIAGWQIDFSVGGCLLGGRVGSACLGQGSVNQVAVSRVGAWAQDAQARKVFL